MFLKVTEYCNNHKHQVCDPNRRGEGRWGGLPPLIPQDLEVTKPSQVPILRKFQPAFMITLFMEWDGERDLIIYKAEGKR